MLGEMPRLRTLRALIYDSALARTMKRPGNRRCPDLTKLPGFNILKTVRVSGELVFCETDPATEKLLRAAMFQPQNDLATEKIVTRKHAKESPHHSKTV